MHFSFAEVSPLGRYKLLTGLVVPRPIAWVTSRNPNGTLNLAPFSFFNAIGTEPGLIVLGIGDHPDRPKDTATNIQRESEFVVNLVPESLAQAMSDSATDYPAEVSEVETLQLPTAASRWIATPRIAGCPAAIECKLERTITIGENRIIFGEVVGVWVDDDMVSDQAKYLVESEKLNLIGRMGGAGGYTLTQETFQIERKRYPSRG